MQLRNVRIAVLVSRFPCLSETFIALQVSALSKVPNCDVEIFSFGARGEDAWLPKGEVKTLQKIPAHHFDIKVRSVSKVVRYASLIRKHGGSFLHYLITRRKPTKVKTLVNELYLLEDLAEFDIVLCQFATIANNLVTYKKYGFLSDRPKLCCAVRGYDVSMKNNLKTIQWAEMFERFDLFLPVCHYFENVLKELGCRSKISVCPSPVNIEHLTAGEARKDYSGDVRLISVGRLVEKKGIDVALKACGMLKEAGVKFHYHIVGNGPDFDLLAALRSRLGLDEEVTLHGALASERVIRLYADVDLLIAPSKTGSDGDSEGIPNVLKEAMMAGIPVVSTVHAGIPELVEHGVTGYMCDENDDVGLFNAISEALSQRSDWPAIVIASQKKVASEYDPNQCAQKLVNDFCALLD